MFRISNIVRPCHRRVGERAQLSSAPELILFTAVLVVFLERSLAFIRAIGP
jgi:hypothetical protein